jgi:hypothetical protein
MDQELTHQEQELYRAYVRYLDDARGPLIGLVPAGPSRDFLLRIHRPMTPEAFHAALARLGPGSARIDALRRQIEGGYRTDFTPQEEAQLKGLAPPLPPALRAA